MSIFTNSTASDDAASSSSAGSIALHGPHQGAQKSTTTGEPARSTSASKVSSVTARTRWTLAAQAQQSHAPHGFEHDSAAHLRVPDRAIVEDDRYLDHPEAATLGAVGQLDLEGVALGGDRVEVERLEHGAPEALEAAGRILDAHPQPRRRVQRAAAGDRAANQPPVADPAPGDVAGAECDVCALLDGGDQPRHVRRIVREVAVHLQDELGALVERAAEAGEVRRAEPLLALAMEDGDERQLRGEAIGELPGAVGRVVVDHEHAVAVAQNALQGAQHRLEILVLVVGRQADGGAHVGAYDRHHGGTA